MPVILKVSNVHFNAAATSRLEYSVPNTINLVANTNGVTITQNAFSPIQANTITIGTSSVPVSNLHIGDNSVLDIGGNVKIYRTSTNLNFTGAGHSYSFDKALKGGNSTTTTLLKKPTTQLFTANGTWSKPTGCRYIKVTVQGGGGGGGGATNVSGNDGYGGGGGSGSIGIKWLDVSNWSNTTTVTIGTGSGSIVSDSFAPTGNTSSFGTHITAEGGDGGQCMNSGGSTYVFYRGGHTVNSCIGGDINVPSGTGMFALRLDGSNGISGRGGKSFLGQAAPGGSQSTANFSRAGGYGGGGGGASATSADTTGGTGGNGFVLVEEFY